MLGCSSDDEEPDTAGPEPQIADNWRLVSEQNCDADDFFNEEVRTATEEECEAVFATQFYNESIYKYESGSNYLQPSGCYRDVLTIKIKFNNAVTNVTCGTDLQCLCICKFSNCATPS